MDSLDSVVKDLYAKLSWLSRKLDVLSDEDQAYLKTLDAYHKVGKLLYDFLKLKGPEKEEDLASLLAKLPSKVEKRGFLERLIGLVR